MTHAGHMVRVGVDIGGTFTDIVLETAGELHSVKMLTRYARPEEVIVEGVVRAVEKAGIAPSSIDMVVHGTTLVTNALIERRGAKTAFLTSKGFRDVVEMRTENRFEQYDLNIVLPEPLVAREDRYVAAGRIGASGMERAPLDEDAVSAFAETVVEKAYDSVAIGFMHAYANAAHEERARDIIVSRAPNIAVSISSHVSPQMREFERFNTVCANAYVKPAIGDYLKRLASGLKRHGVDCPAYMIHSGGGLISLETAAEFPVRLLESGPAGGAMYAADVAARHGLERVLSYDMGGTTAKICLIENGTPKSARTFEVARTYRFKKGSGTPVSIPVIEMVEIGAGGGSLARVDDMRQVRVGPESAGSEPGPACYQRGGRRPSVTDADLVLGRIDAKEFAGGDIALSVDAARQALSEVVGDRLQMNAETAAIGVCEVVDENMANAARVHAIENGKDPVDFTMIAFGGAAPLHAARLSEKLGISRLLVPPGAGVGSAIGFLRTPFAYEAVRGLYQRLDAFEAARVNVALEELQREAEAIVQSKERIVQRTAFMRYAGQGWEIPVDVPDGAFVDGDTRALRSAFEAEYARLFGRPLADLDVEIMNWSVRVASPTPAIAPVPPAPGGIPAPEPVARRRFYDASQADFVEAPVFLRSDLRPGAVVSGPALVVEHETTTVITSRYDFSLQSDGCLALQKRT